jgi:uncharacterized protein (DUF4415 family)
MKNEATSPASQTDFARIDAIGDDDIDYSEIPEVSPEMFARAIVRKGLKPVQPKVQLTLRLDADTLSWFRAQGKGYQTRINSILTAYKEAHEARR